MTQTQISEKPILLNGQMVRATLEGNKTHTRRVMNPQPSSKGYLETTAAGELWYIYPKWDEEEQSYLDYFIKCPYGNVGDQLWVRETWQASPKDEFMLGNWYEDVPKEFRNRKAFMYTYYRADMSQYQITNFSKEASEYWGEYVLNPTNYSFYEYMDEPKWRPSIFMPRWASRIQLQITDIRVERLQDISERDAFAEGIRPKSEWKLEPRENEAIDRFRWLWNCINGKPRKNGLDISWNANPFVWVVEFKRLQK